MHELRPIFVYFETSDGILRKENIMLTSTTVASPINRRIKLTIYPGHYATSHAHVDNYISMTELRSDAAMAHEAAAEIANKFRYIKVDTIVCLECTQLIGAFLAKELMDSRRSVNAGSVVHVVTPEINSNNQLSFNSELQEYITGHNVALLMSTVSTGRSLARAGECISYYGGHLVGIGAIFSAIRASGRLPIHCIFKKEDLHEYNSYQSDECPFCKQGRKLDGVINTVGCTRL